MDVITLDGFQCVLENLRNLHDLHISIAMPVLTGDAFLIRLVWSCCLSCICCCYSGAWRASKSHIHLVAHVPHIRFQWSVRRRNAGVIVKHPVWMAAFSFVKGENKKCTAKQACLWMVGREPLTRPPGLVCGLSLQLERQNEHTNTRHCSVASSSTQTCWMFLCAQKGCITISHISGSSSQPGYVALWSQLDIYTIAPVLHIYVCC